MEAFIKKEEYVDATHSILSTILSFPDTVPMLSHNHYHGWPWPFTTCPINPSHPFTHDSPFIFLRFPSSKDFLRGGNDVGDLGEPQVEPESSAALLEALHHPPLLTGSGQQLVELDTESDISTIWPAKP